MKKEVWKDIPGYTGYQASNLGNVRSYRKRKTGKLYSLPHILSGSKDKLTGRRGVNIRVNEKSVYKRVAYLVILTFVGPRPKGNVIRHLNDIPSDDRLTNLSYGTPRENVMDAFRNGRFTNVPIDVIQNIGMKYSTGNYSQKDLGAEFHLNISTINKIVNERYSTNGILAENIRQAIKEMRGQKRSTPVNTVIEIRRKYATGKFLMRELSNEYELDLSTISRIINKRRRKDVTTK